MMTPHWALLKTSNKSPGSFLHFGINAVHQKAIMSLIFRIVSPQPYISSFLPLLINRGQWRRRRRYSVKYIAAVRITRVPDVLLFHVIEPVSSQHHVYPEYKRVNSKLSDF